MLIHSSYQTVTPLKCISATSSGDLAPSSAIHSDSFYLLRRICDHLEPVGLIGQVKSGQRGSSLCKVHLGGIPEGGACDLWGPPIHALLFCSAN